MTVDWIYDSHVMKVLQVVNRRKLKLQLLKKMQVLSCIINITGKFSVFCNLVHSPSIACFGLIHRSAYPVPYKIKPKQLIYRSAYLQNKPMDI